MNKCQMKIPPFYQCCCHCALLLINMDNDTREQKGFACGAFLFEKDGVVITPWPSHSVGCEMYMPDDEWEISIKKKDK